MWLPYSKYHMFREIWMVFPAMFLTPFGSLLGALFEIFGHKGSILGFKQTSQKNRQQKELKKVLRGEWEGSVEKCVSP